MEFVLIFIVSVIIGGMIGSAKGQAAAGLLLSLLLGPLGVLIVLCLPNLVKQKEEQERKRQLDLQLQLQRAQLDKLEQMQQTTSAPSRPPPPGAQRRYHVGRNGEDIGELAVSEIRTKIQSGELTLQDYYFDPAANDWLTLESLGAEGVI
jgi:type II secretory pathway pseudopilin PulG